MLLRFYVQNLRHPYITYPCMSLYTFGFIHFLPLIYIIILNTCFHSSRNHIHTIKILIYQRTMLMLFLGIKFNFPKPATSIMFITHIKYGSSVLNHHLSWVVIFHNYYLSKKLFFNISLKMSKKIFSIVDFISSDLDKESDKKVLIFHVKISILKITRFT